ncbi:Retrotransposon gag domain-containing 1 [Gossypium australe]|uniref:Retrotransposon gag domain-containing 1 n=1 Tax=Gossypium australe TaxID=47621 RepID=A0A5B6W7Q8_9ROSI|nr:Retrotransposon gag domain-containing 1 [Gossypium australe]
MDPNRAKADDVESNAPAPAQGTSPSKSRPVTIGQREGAREVFLHMINEWYTEFVRTNLTAQPPSPPPIHQSVLVALQVPRERVNWEFFQDEFRKKYISQRFTDQKHKEFLELKQGRMLVIEYKQKFVRLSKYAQECVSTEAIMCKRFEDGLNEDIRLLVGVLELKEFVVLFD